jgi:phosphatidylethanolamine/phosphatidyl-N-methylethanolamine N-methyltransferase
MLLVNHFLARNGARRWIEQALAPASGLLGWHPNFAMESIFSDEDMARIEVEHLPPMGLFTLVHLRKIA